MEKKYKKSKLDDKDQEKSYAQTNEGFSQSESRAVSQNQEVTFTSEKIQMVDNECPVVTVDNLVQNESVSKNIMTNSNTFDEAPDLKEWKL